MSVRWAVSLPRAELAAAQRLCRAPRIEMCEQGPLIWLRGAAGDERVEQQLRMIPGARRFAVLGDGQLQPIGGRVPSGHLPVGPWTPLADWFDFELPATTWPGELPERIPVTLVRGGARADVGAEPELLLTSLSAWSAYARTAPRVRLERWAFAVDERSRVLVRGQPLPPLAGQRFIRSAGIAIPIGWRVSPDVDPQTVWETLRHETPELMNGDLVILFPDNTWECVPGDSFVRADRSAIRLTAEASDVAG